MRILLDECLPKQLKKELPGYEVSTVPEAGWAGKKNGELLKLAETRFDVFVTIDQNLTYQQNLQKAKIAVITLAAPSNRLEDIQPLVPQLLAALRRIKPGELIQIES